MKDLHKIISEKLHIGKRYNGSNEFSDEPLYLCNNCVTFPCILEIDHKYNETIEGYQQDEQDKYDRLIFFNDKDEKICTMTWKEIIMIFDDEKGIMLNTKYGWKPVIWRP